MIEVIRRHSTPIPGVVEAVAALRRQGLLIGSCTGYPRSVGEQLADQAGALGYFPDVLVCATDVPRSRPEPDMCLKILADWNIEEACTAVKVGDTVQDVLEGVRAGMWVIGITLSGSMAGMTERELSGLSDAEKWKLHEKISDKLTEAGAHFTVPNLPACVETLHVIDKLCQRKFKP
jgi:phosphonoacetaldehyde hydrolase